MYFHGILRNILKIETESELREFIGSLLDLSHPKNKFFLDELLKKLNKPISNIPNMTVKFFFVFQNYNLIIIIFNFRFLFNEKIEDVFKARNC